MNLKLKPIAPAPQPHSTLEAELAGAAAFIRRQAVAAIYRAGSGDAGAALACADLLAALYGAELNVWPSAPDDPWRDRFILSKAEAAPALYAAGAHYGFCDARAMLSLRKLGSPFQGHPHVLELPFVEASTGTPGQGLSVALGMALGLRLERKPARVYALLGDDELEAGQVWEAAMAAARQGLDNLCALIDCSIGRKDERGGVPLEPLAAKWRAFGWAVAEIDGHDIGQILATFRRASASHGRPAAIIAQTVAGKGVPFLERRGAADGRMALTRRQAQEALAALGAEAGEIEELLHV